MSYIQPSVVSKPPGRVCDLNRHGITGRASGCARQSGGTRTDVQLFCRSTLGFQGISRSVRITESGSWRVPQTPISIGFAIKVFFHTRPRTASTGQRGRTSHQSDSRRKSRAGHLVRFTSSMNAEHQCESGKRRVLARRSNKQFRFKIASGV